MTEGNPIEGYWLVPMVCVAVASVLGWLALAQARRIERRLDRDAMRTRIVSGAMSVEIHRAVKGGQ